MWAGEPNTGGGISLWQAGAHDGDLAAGELLQVPRDGAVAEHHHAPGRRQVGGGRAALERLLVAALRARGMAVSNALQTQAGGLHTGHRRQLGRSILGLGYPVLQYGLPWSLVKS